MTSARFFGVQATPLFGVYHPALKKKQSSSPASKPSVRAAIICPPIGQEYIRTHWCLRLMAKQLSRNDIHVLRLDYQGIGDSFGTPEQVQSMATWIGNIQTAIDYLKAETGATTVMLIGNRLGGSLAAEVAQQRQDVNSIVLWEPVTSGQRYLEKLRNMHARMLDLWVCRMKTPNDQHAEEILGTRYSRSLLDSIEAYSFHPSEIIQPQLIVDAASETNNYEIEDASLQKVIVDPDGGGWYDMQELETARLRPQSTRTIVKTVDDMFQRLSRFHAVSLAALPTPATQTLVPDSVNVEVH